MSTVALRMARTIRHRGPDDSGHWIDPAAGVALAHRRLSIIDLSPLGHQPMASAHGAWIIAFNGEIYNFEDLRRELTGKGHVFRGRSDTEVMLAAFEEWGVGDSLKRFNGMFAFAVWNRETRTLFLARDRLGKKPLYYGWAGNCFLFGSELKALKAHPAFRGEVDRGVLALYLRHNYVPSPYSIYQGISSLPPAAFVEVSSHSPRAAPSPQFYWSAKETAENGRLQLLQSVTEALERLDLLLRDAVKLRMIADVPLGAFLSGGIDSSLVVSLMQAQSPRPVKTFSIGFREEGFDEAGHARDVANHLGTDHTELYVTPGDAMNVIPRLPEMFDEPFADSSQIPTFLVSRLARSEVTVSLSGDGGDELFAGYQSYSSNRRFWAKYGRLPLTGRKMLAWGVRLLSPEAWDGLFSSLGALVPQATQRDGAGIRLHRMAAALSQDSEETVYQSLISHWQPPFSLVNGACEPPTVFTDRRRSARLESFVERMMYCDTLSYLPDDILVKVDRASMAVSLEARCPLLDYRVAEFAWQVPLSMKIREGKGKWLLRQLLLRYVPERLFERPKAGFAPPVGEWIRGPMRPWVEELLRRERISAEGYLDAQLVRSFWERHSSGKANLGARLWPVLMFQAWLDASRT